MGLSLPTLLLLLLLRSPFVAASLADVLELWVPLFVSSTRGSAIGSSDFEVAEECLVGFVQVRDRAHERERSAVF